VTSDPTYRIRSEAALELSREALTTRARLAYMKLSLYWHNLALKTEEANDRPARKDDEAA
jgi:hypothetical protein